MSSQFEKRLKKAKPKGDTAVAPVEKPTAKSEQVYTQTGMDVYTSDGGRTYGVAEIAYNPETGEAKVVDIFFISRLIALQYANQKGALNTLKQKHKRTLK